MTFNTGEINPEFEPYVRQAVHLATDKTRPISHIEADFERLVSAIYVYSRTKLLDQIREQREKDFEEEIRRLPYF